MVLFLGGFFAEKAEGESVFSTSFLLRIGLRIGRKEWYYIFGGRVYSHLKRPVGRVKK